MNDQLKDIVKQARLPACHLSHPVALKRFAELLRQDEREACAKLCDDLQLTDLAIRDWSDGTYDCAKAIRARGEK